eukprot:TRINITY_DN1312_c0_g2_i1.p1 TRINITY_DN1312_c0_g2~~TRINITY_DN1312_c0_g2_i1.p1  ORF type:complete len:423 (+),score=121.37 TRINITY_DN1312_c0_g2_i1:77-1345(+)
MANVSFRARPIDINKQLPIFKDAVTGAEDVDFTPISRSLPQMPTGMDREDEEEAHIQEAIKQSLRGAAPEKVSIPTPRVKEVRDEDDRPSYVPPISYIRYNPLTTDEWDVAIEYDADSDDEIFANQSLSLPTDRFEFLMDRFEKEASKTPGRLPPFVNIQSMFPDEDLKMLKSIYDWWMQKRKKNLGHPLNTRFIVPPDPDDPDPFKPFRVRTELEKAMRKKSRKNDTNTLTRMRHLRQEMERVRTILEMMKKREKIKQDILITLQENFDVQCNNPTWTEDMGDEVEEDDYADLFQHGARQNRRRIINDEISEDDMDIQDSAANRPNVDDNFEMDEPEARVDDVISLAGLPPFRGRCRIGRGGRIFVDRCRPPPQCHGVVDSDPHGEHYSRVVSLVEDYNMTVSPESDAEKLLRLFMAVQDQ